MAKELPQSKLKWL